MPHRLIESLESRQLLSATLTSGILTVGGTAGNDVITINAENGNLITKVNAETKTFKLIAVTKIVVNALGGNDKVSIGAAVNKPTTINGGDGNDAISGGSGNDAILGGTGNDTEAGGLGNDTMDGGSGNDTVAGNGGSDSLTGGTGNDVLDGGLGNDTLNGNAGTNVLKGGDGGDSFVAGGGSDFVTDKSAADTGEPGGVPAPVTGATVFGTIASLGDTSITVTVIGDGGAIKTSTFSVNADTKITANDVVIPFSSLTVGLKVVVVPATGTTNVAGKILPVGAQTDGVVSAINGDLGTVALKADAGQPDRQFTLSPTVKVFVGNTSTPGTLASVTVGSKVHFQFSPLNANQVINILVTPVAPPPPVITETTGAVVSVTTSPTKTITVTGGEGGSNRTFTLGAEAKITVDGVSTDLGNLPAGLTVGLRLSTSNNVTTVTTITAAGAKVTGVVSAVNGDGHTITLAATDAKPATTYTVSPTATIKLNEVTTPLGAIPAGATVTLQLSGLDGSTVIGIDARKTTPPPPTVTSTDGVITTVDGPGLLIGLKGATGQPDRVFKVSPTASIVVDGLSKDLGQLPIGQVAILTITGTGDAATVTAIAVYGPKINGKVASVNGDARTITLTAEVGTGPTYSVAANAVITLNNVTKLLGQIPTNATVVLQMSALNSNTVLKLVATLVA